MNLIEKFREECVQIGTDAKDKDGVLLEITRLAKRCEVLRNCTDNQIFQALQERERIGSTAFGGGIAIPHCALDNIDDFVVGLLTVPEGVDFDSTGGDPTHLLTFIVGPAQKRNEHVSLLSAISRVLNDEKTVEELVAARDQQALAESFLRHHSDHIPHPDKPKCLFHVVVQEEAFFNDILEIFSSAVEGDISVIDAGNAGDYLNRIPMFAAFWGEQNSGFCRIVLAVVDKDLCNDVVRRINVLVDDLEHNSGTLITVQELMLARGSLNF